MPTVTFSQVSLSLLHPREKTKPKNKKGEGEREGGGEGGERKQYEEGGKIKGI